MTGCAKCHSGLRTFWIVQWNAKDAVGQDADREAKVFNHEKAVELAAYHEGIVAYERVAACSCTAGQARAAKTHGKNLKIWRYDDLVRDVEKETRAA